MSRIGQNSLYGLIPLAVFVIVATVPCDVALGQQAYPLVCRGGSGMEATVMANPGWNTFTLDIRFRRQTGAAKFGIGDGSCAWQDRGVRGNKPNQIHYETRAVVVMQCQATQCSFSSNDAPLEHVYKAIRKGSDFTVNVYNEGGRWLRVQSIQ